MPRGKKAAAATTTPQSQTVTPFEQEPPVNGGSSSSPLPNGHTVAAASDVGGEQSTEDATPGGVISALIQKQMDTEGIEQFELPRAVITRVAKNALPDNVQIRKDAVLAISKSATIFISYLSAVSDELAKQNARKTISVSDVLEGLGLMDFPEDIRSEVKTHLKAFRQSQSDKKAGKAVKGDAAGAGGEEDEEDDEEEGDADTQETTTRPDTVEEPPAKPTGEQDVDEEDEDTEQRMVEEGAQEGEVEDDPMDEDN